MASPSREGGRRGEGQHYSGRGVRGGGDYYGRGGGGRGGGRAGGRGFGGHFEEGGPSSSSRKVILHIKPANVEYKRATALDIIETQDVLTPPKKPGVGTIGDEALIHANHFRVRLDQSRHIFHYDVSIELVGSSVVLSLDVNREVLKMVEESYRQTELGGLHLAYDGRKNIYTAGPLPLDDTKTFVVERGSERHGRVVKYPYRVTIKFAAKLELNSLQEFLDGMAIECPYKTIQALDVVLRTGPSLTCVTVSRSFFKSGDVHLTLGGGVECWKGCYQSLRPTQMGLSLNVDQSVATFLESKMLVPFVIDILNIVESEGFQSDMRLSPVELLKITKVLKNAKVQTVHGPKMVYRIKGLTHLPADQLTFVLDQQEITVEQYFQNKYRKHLDYPKLPCILAGSDRKPIYVPMEVCQIIPVQRYTRKLDNEQVKEMLAQIRCSPSKREKEICRMLGEKQFASDPLVRDFRIEVETQSASVKARVLPPPLLECGGDPSETIKPNDGKWNMNNKKMETGARVEYWAFINLSSHIQEAQAESFCARLSAACRKKGMNFARYPVAKKSIPPSGGESVDVVLHNLRDQSQATIGQADRRLELIVVILPDQRGCYGCIKRICDTELGIVSQCLQSNNVLKDNPPYLSNVALKINVKAGGRNTVVRNYMQIAPPVHFITDKWTIIFGADVTHPHPGEDSSPSIAAVVASMDWPGMAMYRAVMSTQTHRQEIISDLSTLTRKLLKAFKLRTQRDPERIIFYRDGVSEGQFNGVLLYEMQAIRKACRDRQCDPSVTFVIVQKRHHTRLIPVPAKREQRVQTGNVKPGTVVDALICHPREFDFYLCSHAGIQGTSRPTHYHVLHDENNFTADALQLLTNDLCYTHARCTRSVSVVPAAYYAHLAAYRARYYIEGDAPDSGSSATGSATSDDVMVRALPKIMANVKDTMFFC